MKQFLLLFSLSFFLVATSCDNADANPNPKGKTDINSLQSNLGNPLGDNSSEQVSLLEEKAEKGDVKAQLELGARHYLGRDYTEGVKWLSRAAQQNNAMAQYLLGIMYYHGNGVTQDYDEAFRLTKLSAEQGFGEAQVNLGGFHYFLGKGTPRDFVRAYMWLSLSTANLSPEVASNATVKERIETLKNGIFALMTAAEKQQADQLATACKNNNYKNC